MIQVSKRLRPWSGGFVYEGKYDMCISEQWEIALSTKICKDIDETASYGFKFCRKIRIFY